MDHEEIEARHLVDLYVARQLSSADSARFEEHFVDCPRCLDQIEAGERFTQGLKRVARDVAVAPPAQPPRRHWAWMAAAAALMMASGVALWQVTRAGRLENELAAARATALEWKQRYEVKQAEPPPALVASTFLLNTTRSASPGAMPNRVPVATAPHWVVLSLDRDWEPGFSSVRANLDDAAGHKRLWQQEALAGTPGTPVSVVLPSALLVPGDYVLRIEGKPTAGGYQAAGSYRFRVSRP